MREYKILAPKKEDIEEKRSKLLAEVSKYLAKSPIKTYTCEIGNNCLNLSIEELQYLSGYKLLGC